KELKIEDAESILYRMDSTAYDTVFVSQFDVQLNNISTYVTTFHYKVKWFNFDRARLRFNKLHFVLPGGLYRLETNQLLYDSDDSEVRLDSFSLKSEFSKYEIAHQTGVQTDWFDINSKTLTLKNLDL